MKLYEFDQQLMTLKSTKLDLRTDIAPWSDTRSGHFLGCRVLPHQVDTWQAIEQAWIILGGTPVLCECQIWLKCLLLCLGLCRQDYRSPWLTCPTTGNIPLVENLLGQTLRRSKVAGAFKIILYLNGGQHGVIYPAECLVFPNVFCGGCHQFLSDHL